MPRPKRIIQNTGLDEAIKKAAWNQIQEQGAAALSLAVDCTPAGDCRSIDLSLLPQS